MTHAYIALIGDAIASRELPAPRRARLQRALRAALPTFNRRWRTTLAARFALTLGDEFQCLLTGPAALWDIARAVRAELADVDWAFACGRGPVTTPLTPGITAPEVDGPCFHAARAAMDRAKQRHLLFAFQGFGDADPILNAFASYYSGGTRAGRPAAARRPQRHLAPGPPDGLASRRAGRYYLRKPSRRPRYRGRGAPPVNPLTLVPLLVYTLAATLWPAQIDGHRRGRELLLVEAVIVAAAIAAGIMFSNLVVPRPTGLWWGRAGLLATAYFYVCGRGITLVRAVLDLPPLQMRRDEDRTAGAIEIARGRTIGVLERALTVTLVLLGQYGALGLIVAAKSLARFKALEDREFAEYFLIGTLASLLLGLIGGVAVRLALSGL